MSPEAKVLLGQLVDAYTRGSFAQACDGKDQEAAHELEELGLAEWKGISFGSSFYAVTDRGLHANPS